MTITTHCAAGAAVPPHGRADHVTASVNLHDGSQLVLSTQLPSSTAHLASAAMRGALYAIAGRIDRPTGHLGFYIGEASDLTGQRAASSYRRFVRTTGRMHPLGLALLQPNDPHSPYWQTDYRRYVEARTIMGLSALDHVLINTRTSAGKHSQRLSRQHKQSGQADARAITAALHYYLLQSQRNTHPAPASNAREYAVRAVLHVDRALDTDELVQLVRRNGHISRGVTPAFTLRRDLAIREAETAGTPRIYTTTQRGRVLYWNPAIRKRDAIARYNQANP